MDHFCDTTVDKIKHSTVKFVDLLFWWFYFSGLEVGDTVWFVWNTNNHTGCDLLQYQKKSRMAEWEDVSERFYCVSYGKYEEMPCYH